MISDYYFVRKGYLQTRDLYSAQKGGPYFYTWGVHWRGYAAYITGILINIVGFAGAVGIPVPIGATYSKLGTVCLPGPCLQSGSLQLELLRRLFLFFLGVLATVQNLEHPGH